MTDPRFPPDLIRMPSQIEVDKFDELAQVKGLLSKLSDVSLSDSSQLQTPLQQLGTAQQSLSALTDQMHDLHRAFQAMQSWQSHITTSYKDLAPDHSPSD